MITRFLTIVLFTFLFSTNVHSQSSYEYAYHMLGQSRSKQMTIQDNNEVTLMIDQMFNNHTINTTNDSIISKYYATPVFISNYITDGSRFAMKDFLDWDVILGGFGNSISEDSNIKSKINSITHGIGTQVANTESIIYFGKGIYGLENSNGQSIKIYDTLSKTIRPVEINNGAFMQNSSGDSYYLTSKNLYKFDSATSQIVLTDIIVAGLDSLATYKGNITYHPKSDHYYIYKTAGSSTSIVVFSIRSNVVQSKTINLPFSAASLIVEDNNIIWLSTDSKLHWYNTEIKKDSIYYPEFNKEIVLNKLYRKNNKTFVLGLHKSLLFPIFQVHLDGEKYIPYRNDLSLTLRNDKAEIDRQGNGGYYIKTAVTATIKNNSVKAVNKFNIESVALIGPSSNYIYEKKILPGESIDLVITESNFSPTIPIINKRYVLKGADYLVDMNPSDNIKETRLSVPTKDVEFEKNITITPNPSQDIITIKSEIPISEITIYDQVGKEVLRLQNEAKINISSFLPGYYIASMVIDGRRYSKSFIKN
jgi:hypothetical protein